MLLRRRISGPLLLAVAAWAFLPPMQAQFVQQGPKLVAGHAFMLSDPCEQGASVALSTDGNTALVGAPGCSVNTGRASVWSRTTGVWTLQEGWLTPGGSYTRQGQSVALSADGNTALVGGPGKAGLASATGGVWVWTRSNGAWTQQGSTLSGAGSVGTDVFLGSSAAISADGNTALVGGPGDNGGAGAVWIWTRNGAVWTPQGSKLVGLSAVGNAAQGTSVALSADGNTALVGGPGDDGGAGAVWVWTRSGAVWTQGSKLVGSGAVGNASQGSSVALSSDGNTAAIGGPQDGGGAGAVWVWTRSNGIWTEGPKLAGAGAVGLAKQGSSVSLSGDGSVLVSGGPSNDSATGGVWVWNRSGSNWIEQNGTLLGSGANSNAHQGAAVAVSADGSTVLAGGPADYGGSLNLFNLGAVWVFAWGQPYVTGNPADQTVSAGANVSFTAAGTGAPSPSVQWQVSSDHGQTFTDITGAVSTTHAFVSAPSLSGTQYRAVFSNTVGSAFSSAATLTVILPVLGIQKAHVGSFTQGQTGVWTINVSNTGLLSTSGAVTVTDTLPAGYTLASYAGTDWLCSGSATVTCTSSDITAPGNDFSPLNLTVNVPSTSPTTVQNQAAVSGGGAVNSATSNVDVVSVTQVFTKLNMAPYPRHVHTHQPFSIAVDVEDAAGSRLTDSTATVSLTSLPPGVTGTLTLNANSGIATFDKLSFPAPGFYTLTAGSQGITSAGLTIAVNQVRDFAGNGRSGVLSYNPATGSAYTALSNGDGTYHYVYNLFTRGFDTLRTGDVNGDGKADLALYNSHTALAYIGMSNGDGKFAFQSLFWSPGYDFVEAGDISGDGKTGFVLYNSANGTMYAGISNGDGSFRYRYTLVSRGYTCVRVADFNGDGKPDLLLYRRSDGLAHLGLGDGTGRFAFSPLTMSPGYDFCDAGDLDDDGMADVIVYNSATGNAATGMSNGAGAFTFVPSLFSPGFTSVRLGYRNGVQAIATLYNGRTATAYLGVLGNGWNFGSLFWSPGYDYVELHDVNNDGSTDFVLYNSATGTSYTGVFDGYVMFNYTYALWGRGQILAR